MLRLLSLIYSITATVLMGVGIVFALVAGYVSALALIIAIATGFALAVPVSWLIAKELYKD